VRKWVDKAYTFERRKRSWPTGGFSRAAYDRAGRSWAWAVCTFQKTYGGLGMGRSKDMVVMEELGRGIVLEPLASA
jgi:hypothetical protein